MTGRTHDLAAFTALNATFILLPLTQMSLATMAVAIAANMIGGLFPDLDNATADIWDKLRWGEWIGKLVAPLVGGHRQFSHSLLGMFVFGGLMNIFLEWIKPVLIVDMAIVWWAFMIGYASHLLADGVTREGVPLLFPLGIKFGLPPIKKMRIKTGAFFEKSIIFPSMILFNGYLIFNNYAKVLDFLRNYLK